MTLFVNRKSGSGFTLIEVLVVVAIIGILATVVLASLNTARQKARDTSRMASIREIQKALEVHFSDYGYYPLQVIPAPISNLSTSLVPSYISSINYNSEGVVDPVYYRPAHMPGSYLIYVSLETQTQASPVSYGCRTGIGPVVDSGLYPTSPTC